MRVRERASGGGTHSRAQPWVAQPWGSRPQPPAQSLTQFKTLKHLLLGSYTHPSARRTVGCGRRAVVRLGEVGGGGWHGGTWGHGMMAVEAQGGSGCQWRWDRLVNMGGARTSLAVPAGPPPAPPLCANTSRAPGACRRCGSERDAGARGRWTPAPAPLLHPGLRPAAEAATAGRGAPAAVRIEPGRTPRSSGRRGAAAGLGVAGKALLSARDHRADHRGILSGKGHGRAVKAVTGNPVMNTDSNGNGPDLRQERGLW